MAFTFPTSTATIESFAAALYGYGLGTTTLSSVENDALTNGLSGNGLNTALNNYYSISFGAVSTATIAKNIVANVGLGTDANAIAYVTGQLNAAAPNARGAAVVSILNAFSGLTADPTYGAAATAWTNTVGSLVAYGQNTQADAVLATAVKAGQAAQTAAASAGQTYTLTTGVDNFTGTSGNDTFDASAQGSFSALDTLVGGGGNDVLNVTSTATTGFINPTGATVSGIGTINVTSTGGLTFDARTGYTGLNTLVLTDVNATGSAGNLVAFVPATTNLTVGMQAPTAMYTTADGGNNITANVAGSTSESNADYLTIGGTTAPKGVVTATFASQIATSSAIEQASAVTVTGGTTVTVNQTTQSTTTPVSTVGGNYTAYTGDVMVIGKSTTTSVTVNNPTPIAAAYTASATNNTTNGVAAQDGVGDGAVKIYDANYLSPTAANTITSVTLVNTGAGSLGFSPSGGGTSGNTQGSTVNGGNGSFIFSNNLQNLTLTANGVGTSGSAISAGAVTITDNSAIPTATTLALNLTGRYGTITDNTITTLNVTAGAGARSSLTAAALTTLNISGGQYRLDSPPPTLTAINVTGAGAYRGDISTTLVSSINAAGTTGKDYVVLNAATQTFTGGSGANTVAISVDAKGVIDGGSSGTNTLYIGSPLAASEPAISTSTFTAANTGVNVKNFQTIATASNSGGTAATAGTIDLSLFAANTFTTINAASGAAAATVTFKNVAPNTALSITPTASTATPAVIVGGSVVYQTSDNSGFNDSVAVTMVGASATYGTGTRGYTIAGLTLQDANGIGIANTTITTDASVSGGQDSIAQLTDTYLSKLSIVGTGGLIIGAAGSSFPSLVISDNDSSTAKSGIGTLTDTSLANISYSGTHKFDIAALSAANTSSTSFTVSNANTSTTGVLSLGVNTVAYTDNSGSSQSTSASPFAFNSNSFTKINLSGSVAASISSSSTGGTANTITVNGATDNQNVTLSFSGAASDVISLGNGNNSISLGTLGTDVVTLGYGGSTVTSSAGGADSISFASHSSSSTTYDEVVITELTTPAKIGTLTGKVVSSLTVGQEATIITGLASGDKISLYGVDPTAGTTIVTTITTTPLHGTTVLAQGTYSSSAGTFTASATGSDSIIGVYDQTDHAANSTNFIDYIVLVGYVATGTSSASTGVITLA